MDKPTDLITQTEAAAIIGVSRSVVRRLIKDGFLISYRHPLLIRGSLLLSRSAAEAFWAAVADYEPN